MKLHYKRSREVSGVDSPALTTTEANALRYAAGYVCRNVTGKLKRAKSSNNQELVDCISRLTKIDDEECGHAEEWTKLVNRGGLWKLREPTFKVFCAFEEETRHLLKDILLERSHGMKEKLVTQLISSEEVQFYWSIAAADFDTDNEDTCNEVLKHLAEMYITIRWFAFASAWTESYKQNLKKSTQRSNRLRGKLYTDKCTT